MACPGFADVKFIKGKTLHINNVELGSEIIIAWDKMCLPAGHRLASVG